MDPDDPNYLVSSDPDFDAQAIAQAAAEYLDVFVDELDVFFEHGQWWVTHLDTGESWSVVDVVPREDADTELGFEQL